MTSKAAAVGGSMKPDRAPINPWDLAAQLISLAEQRMDKAGIPPWNPAAARAELEAAGVLPPKPVTTHRCNCSGGYIVYRTGSDSERLQVCPTCGGSGWRTNEGEQVISPNEKLAFEQTYKGFTVKAFWGDELDARIEVFKNDQLFKVFTYPAYRIFNIAAHWQEMVENEIT